MTTVSDFVYTNKNSLSKDFCREIINLYEKEQKMYPGITARGVDKNIKRSMDFQIDTGDFNTWNEINKCLKTEVIKNLEQYLLLINQEYCNVNIKLSTTCDFKFFEKKKLSFNCFMVQRYDVGKGRYVYHDDEVVEKERRRILTYLFYLNDVVEGGETDICNSKFIIKPECGKLLIFPANWCYPHAGNIPVSERKYIVTGWIYVEN